MAEWMTDEEDAVVTAWHEQGRCTVRTANGTEMEARISGFLWFRNVEPPVGASVRVCGPDERGVATIVACN